MLNNYIILQSFNFVEPGLPLQTHVIIEACKTTGFVEGSRTPAGGIFALKTKMSEAWEDAEPAFAN